MKKSSLVVLSFFFIVIIALSVPRRAHAYLDPGTGSYIFQILIAGLIGGLFAIKLFWGRIKGFIGRIIRKDKKKDEEEEGNAGAQAPE